MRLYVLVGPIASGKSTYARQRAREGAIIICFDDLTEMLHGEYRYEQGLRQVYRDMEEALARIALDAGKDVVVDRTHLTKESRARWVGFADRYNARLPEFEAVTAAVWFPRDDAETHARRRFTTDPRGRPYDEWLAVARHHEGQAEAEPLQAAGEGFDAVIIAGRGGGPVWSAGGPAPVNPPSTMRELVERLKASPRVRSLDGAAGGETLTFDRHAGGGLWFRREGGKEVYIPIDCGKVAAETGVAFRPGGFDVTKFGVTLRYDYVTGGGTGVDRA